MNQLARRARVADRTTGSAGTQCNARKDYGEDWGEARYPSHESAACNKKSLTLRPRSKMSQSGSSPLAT